ncbi:MAG TPA: ArsS family sensor histidine kinase [Sulfurovum sp.]|jgi:two-component system OmpR family sensor kinase|nr:MAG: histidine kinase [Sulfurovum sp. 35-42-20]OYY56777.1 MAG: histidine kinase [Sulfurovum sp. 28-43-6]OYZ25936.1 MAG: histidine kinase [Sulfurovum sp. 16-42-52]OYZ47792.1 MAG: histidine kinase [Sulfurovum sp. 24-42-9]OZA46825.1 MAG: histidine kinase [Sulfurovum sp. 17-42-90]OZA59136.1 MAG: histidine kinase [Sulfurovum sp. 39-42-12]HQR74223.1 ArsS family sensor histidine kinase [Sulfurovum sp.]
MIITSLRSKIRVVFSITLFLLVALFAFSIKYDRAIAEETNVAQEQAISHYLYSYYLKYGKIDEAYLDAQNVSLITDKGMVVQIERFFKEKGKLKRYAVDTFRLKRIIIINNDRFKLILENKNKAKFPLKRALVFAVVFLLIIFLYWWIMKSFNPLAKLKSQIQTFSQGNLDIECKSDKKDEIAEVANEFDHAVTMIRELLHSRQLFLRAIMHELKTPIGKGRLVSEMLHDEKSKERLHSIFERLNLLIDEFAKIEKITSKNFDLTIKPYKMSDLLEASIDMLMIDHPKNLISTQIIKDYSVSVDFELFTLVIKNLLDNGIKYSSDKHINVIVENNQLQIINTGEALKEPLEHYFEPFHTSKKGLGLGLYIVKSILDIHHMKVEYRRTETENIFTIR